KRGRDWIDVIGHALFLLPLCVLMVRELVPWVVASIRSGEMSSNAGGLVLWPARAVILAGFVLLLLQGISELIKRIAVMRGLIPDPYAGREAHQVPIE
ncbi:MAG: TRAP transporter small permease subunit, partial [Dongiaceae bacterium]